MATVETLMNTLEAKLKVIEISRKSIDGLRLADNVRECERKFISFDAKITELNELKDQVLEAKLLGGAEESDVETWGQSVDARFATYIKALGDIKTFIDTVRTKETMEQHQLELKRKEELENVKPANVKTADDQFNAKLPKLEIPPFEGDVTDFPRFWSTFSESVDKRGNLPATSKFSYLKERLGPKVSLSVESLPFTTEGYTRAKTILNTKYGRPSEIVNAHVNALMALPTIKGTNPNQINSFYETVAFKL